MSWLLAWRSLLAPETAGVHAFLDGKPAEVDSAGGTVGSLERHPPARPKIPKLL